MSDSEKEKLNFWEKQVWCTFDRFSSLPDKPLEATEGKYANPICIIPLSQIDATRDDYIKERFFQQLDNIQKNNSVIPIWVVKEDDGRYKIRDGHHRVAGAIALDYTSIPAHVWGLEQQQDAITASDQIK